MSRTFSPQRTLSHLGRRQAFTLVELLVVIAIIGILVALLLPAIQAAREAARRSQCGNNLKQIGIAVLNFENARKRLPAGSTTDAVSISGPYMTTWSIDILPYLEQQSLFDRWNPRLPIEGDQRPEIRQQSLAEYLCPSDEDPRTLTVPESGPGNSLSWAPGSYRANSGTSPASGSNGDNFWDNPLWAGYPKTFFPDGSRGPMHTVSRQTTGTQRKLGPNKIAQISDGTAKTRLVSEYMTRTFPSRRTLWSYAYTSYNQSSGLFESRNLMPDYDRCNLLPGIDHGCKRAWGSFHAGGVVQTVFCDGSVRAISDAVDTNLWVASSTIAMGEAVEPL